MLGVARGLDKAGLLTAVLGVVAGIGLVGHQPRQVRHLLFDVGVHRDTRPVTAEVVVEARPRLVFDHLVFDEFAVRKGKRSADPIP